MFLLFDDEMMPLINTKRWETGIFKTSSGNAQGTYYASTKARTFESTADTRYGA